MVRQEASPEPAKREELGWKDGLAVFALAAMLVGLEQLITTDVADNMVDALGSFVSIVPV